MPEPDGTLSPRGRGCYAWPSTVPVVLAEGAMADSSPEPVPLRPAPGADGAARGADAAPRGLPARLEPLIGRASEVAAARALLLEEAVPLLTLTGPGGDGKTRLALRLAADLAPEFADGVAFVDLAPLRDPELVVPAIAQVLGIQVGARRGALPDLVDALRERRLLLVLDNVEQVAAAAPDVAALVAGCPRLSVLATGRAALRASVEREFPVPPLAVPARPAGGRAVSAAAVAEAPAVALFVERARAASPGFALTDAEAEAVAAICRRLDGLPLAIELAAARVKVLSPAALLARLTNRLQVLAAGARDRPERLRTMRATVAWSHDLLAEPERALFRRLAVFAGGCTLEAAEAVVAAAGDPGIDVLDGVASLIDHSLLRRTEETQGQPRFAMLETVREYGLERLGESGEEEATRDAHAAVVLALAERAEPELLGRDQGAWLDRLEAEHDNVRAALAWTLDRGDGEFALRLAGALGRFWRVRGYLAEGAAWLERALAAGAEAPAARRAKALTAAGLLARVRGDFDHSARLLEESTGLARASGDDHLLADALIELAVVKHEADNIDLAEALWTEALDLHRRVGDPLGVDRCQVNLGEVARGRGDFAQAAARYEASLPVVRELGDRVGLGISLMNLGAATRGLGEIERAAAAYHEALEIQRELGNLEHMAYNLYGFAGLALDRGRDEQAARLLGAAAALAEATGAVVERVDRDQVDRDVAEVRTRLGEPAFAAAWAAGRALPLADAVAEALAAAEAAPAPPGRPAAALGLTERELEVLRLLVAGRTDREIAAALFIGRRTAEGHVANILAKLGVGSRTAAAAAALAAGIVAPAADPPAYASGQVLPSSP